MLHMGMRTPMQQLFFQTLEAHSGSTFTDSKIILTGGTERKTHTYTHRKPFYK